MEIISSQLQFQTSIHPARFFLSFLFPIFVSPCAVKILVPRISTHSVISYSYNAQEIVLELLDLKYSKKIPKERVQDLFVGLFPPQGKIIKGLYSKVTWEKLPLLVRQTRHPFFQSFYSVQLKNVDSILNRRL